MKKRVLRFDCSTNTDALDEFLYVMKACSRYGIEFSAVYEKAKGRLEIECDDNWWDRLIGSFACFFEHEPIKEES